MSELALEPYAVQQSWRLPEPLTGSDWQELLITYLAALARACVTAVAPDPAGTSGPGRGAGSVIGHIKLLALCPRGRLPAAPAQ